ncbi:MAG: hypothetical protein LBJ25_04820 [Candidatus Margulisbacteria bacterium]|jgi:hypothetical protein|nr:hypothetical protein [Candidatus Margulisiibacteriota bacterium]
MHKRKLAVANRDTIKKFELATNKYACARQAAQPGLAPAFMPTAEAERIFREAIFTMADSEYLLDAFWRELEQDYPSIKGTNKNRLFIDYVTYELYTMESAHDS